MKEKGPVNEKESRKLINLKNAFSIFSLDKIKSLINDLEKIRKEYEKLMKESS
jgi:hypothetical protein